MADWIPVRFRELLDVVFGSPSDGDAVTYDAGTDKLVLGPPAPVAPTGPAGGVLSGTYPDPGFAQDMATQSELDAHEADTTNVHGVADTSVLATDSDVAAAAAAAAAALAAHQAADVVDGDAAGGDLTGTYPNPQIGPNAVGAAEIANGAVGTTEIADESVTVGKINSGAEAPGRVMVADGSGGAIWDNQSGAGGGSPTGPAGGDLTGTYPNPTLVADAVENAAIQDGAVTASKVDSEASLAGDVLTSDGAGGAVWLESTGGGSPSLEVNQTGHGFSVGEVLRLDGTDYVLAQADTEENAEAVGIVSEVTDADNFVLLLLGHVAGGVLSGLTPGTVYYLDATTPGAVTDTEPELSKAVLWADTATSGFFSFSMRGMTGGGAGAGLSAADVAFVPAGTISSGNVQDAIEEIAAEGRPVNDASLILATQVFG